MNKKTVYILFDGVNANKSAKVHGGGAFSRWIAKELVKRANNMIVSVLWPSGVSPQTNEENEIFCNEAYHVKTVNSAEDMDYKDGDTLFIPIMESFHGKLEIIRAKFPLLRIVTVIHGMRNVDLVRFEKYQIYYHTWYKALPGIQLLSWGRQIRNKKREVKLIQNACKIVDEVYTDSNASMQLILQYASPKSICFYYPASMINISNKDIEYKYTEKYVLMININRPEKNFIRSLVAFCNYKKKNPESKLKFYAVGASVDFIERVKKVKEIDIEIVESQVQYFDYVSTKELYDMLTQAYFLLYPSRSEGYGLPVLDALNVGCPTVASELCSVPEVIGSSAYYVDPYSTESIEHGIEYMAMPSNNNYYRQLIKKSRVAINMRLEADSAALSQAILREI